MVRVGIGRLVMQRGPFIHLRMMRLGVGGIFGHGPVDIFRAGIGKGDRGRTLALAFSTAGEAGEEKEGEETEEDETANDGTCTDPCSIQTN